MVPNGTTLFAKTTMGTLNGTLNSTFLVPTYMSQEEFLALQMTNGSETNSTFNDTFFNQVVLKTWYPSGYSPAHIIIASVVVTVLMIMVVVGNMLVIIAIVTEKALKNIQNWFIASLAVSDFFLGLVIMPFSLANELMGYWIFGFWWCEIHSAMDVLLCTASIMNLCLISLDRYWSITQAVDYLKKRTPARAALMIAAVWLMSALVCIPPLLGWRVTRPPEQFPQCKMPAPRKVSPRQVELLVEFAETHTPIALGRFQGPQANQAARQAWQSLAMQLNSLAEGTSKAPDQWRRYWVEFKARTKTKAADLRRNASSTGGGPSKFVPLTAMEERVLALIGKVAVEGLPEVRIPVNISIEETAVPAANITEETAAPVANITEETDAPVANLTEEAALPTNSLNLGLQMEVECQEDISPPLPSLPPPSDIIAQREERLLRKSSNISFPSTSQRRSRISRPIRRDPNVPRWAYDLEMRRMDIEDHKNMILENTSKEIQLLRETIQELVEVIKNNNNQ